MVGCVCVHGRGVCVAVGHAWQGGVHGRGGMHGKGGHVWQGACMVGDGACMVGGMCGGGVHGRYYEIRSMSERYASYWNAFLLNCLNIFYANPKFAYTMLETYLYSLYTSWMHFILVTRRCVMS